jgi:pSer/pThr/pTyr-binding forkhead associated (FHA) protein
MDDSPRPDEAVSIPLPVPPRAGPPGDFFPLRLLLQPGGLCVELARPDMTFGRHSTADVRLALPDVSRRHCRFVFRDERWEVIDLGSLNGTYVNEQRLQEAVLCHGDTVRVGGLTFRVDLRGESRTLPLPERGPEMLRSIADVLPLPAEPVRKAS